MSSPSPPPGPLPSLLTTYAPKLSLDSASRILLSSPALAAQLSHFLASAYRDPPYSTTIAPLTAPVEGALSKGNGSSSSAVPDDAFTHVFAEIGGEHEAGNSREDVLKVLKRVYYALIPKGIAVVMVKGRGEGSEGGKREMEEELMELAEMALFERGKVRFWDGEGCWVLVAMKWDLLCA